MPFYARRLGRSSRLDRLPFLTKQLAIRHQRELIARRVAPFVGVVSSGTSGGEGVLRVPRTPEEGAAQAEWFGNGDADESLVLEVRAVHHGLEHLSPGKNWLRVPWTPSRNALRLVESVLARPVANGRRVARLLINAGALMPLTVHLLASGRSPARFGLEGISTTSFRLSPHWRALIESSWGAPLFDNYSLSELPCPALECKTCGHHHWQGPPIWPEIVDPLTKRPRDEGVLVISTLYPFVQAMPLLRYWTGDLVSLGPVCRRTKERGVRFRGRLGQSIVGRGGLVLGAQDVVDALEAEPLVARHLHPMEQLGILPESDCGAVKFELERAPLRLRVELKFDPRAFADEARALGARIGAALLEKSPALRRREGTRGELELELVGPGSLTRAWTKW